jgi:hypothetical protein
MDIVPIVFNIKPYHTDSLTKPNIKHRFPSTTGSSQVPSETHTPVGRVEQVPTTGITDPTQVESKLSKLPIFRTLDEQADSAARKCVCFLFALSGTIPTQSLILDNVLWTWK